MAIVRANIKEDILVWARETAGFSVEDAAKKINNVKPERLQQWEKGEAKPTINQLRKMAQVYKRPLSVFYLQEVPARFQVMRDFRRLPGEIAGVYSPSALLEIRLAQERRELALELYAEIDEEPPVLALVASFDDDPEELGYTIRRTLQVSYAKQSGWRDSRASFNGWRSRIENLGVLVFQTTRLETDELRGFSIAEDSLPVIAVNRKDALNGRTFSLLHELTHLMLHVSGLCDFDERAERAPEEQKVEIFCNAVAAAALIPRDRLLAEDTVKAHPADSFEWSDDELGELSRTFSVSRDAALRRLLTFGRTTEQFYVRKRAQFLAEYKAHLERERERMRKQEFRRNPPTEALGQYGRSFIGLVLSNYYQNRITLSDVSGYLGLRVRHVPTLEHLLGKR